MDRLKIAITTAPALATIKYLATLADGTITSISDIIVTLDASFNGWGGLLNQEVCGMKKRKPV